MLQKSNEKPQIQFWRNSTRENCHFLRRIQSIYRRFKWKMSFKQMSTCRKNTVCAFVWTSCTFCLLMHSSVDIHWSHVTTTPMYTTKSIQNMQTLNNGVKQRLYVGIWKYCDIELQTNKILGCFKTAELFGGVMSEKEIVIPEWLMLCWVFMFCGLVINLMSVFNLLYSIYTNSRQRLWQFLIQGFVTFFSLGVVILYSFKNSDYNNPQTADGGSDSNISFEQHQHFEVSERFALNFYLVLLAGCISMANLIKLTLNLKK
eukprot:TCONS_00056647-protein